MKKNFWLSKGFDNIDSDIGVPYFPNIPYLAEDTQKHMAAFELLGEGAHIEDTKIDIGVYSNHRSLYHFFDPQYVDDHGNRGRGMPQPIRKSISSPDWILEDRFTVDHPRHHVQRFSFRDAKDAYFRALTSQSKGERDQAMGHALQALGHVVHHLQDMAQPQHARLDDHCNEYKCAVINKYHPSLYEAYTDDQFECGKFDQSKPIGASYLCEREGEDIFGRAVKIKHKKPTTRISIQGYPAVEFSRARDFWLNSDYNGIAELSSFNFVTQNTSYKIINNNPSNSIGIDDLIPTKFPLPGNENLSLNLYNDNDAGRILYVSNSFRDKYTRTQHKTKITGFSLLNETLKVKGKNPIGIVDHNIFEDRYKILLPAAVGYTKGMINHFFKVNLAVQRKDRKITIQNQSSVPIHGDFYLYKTDNGHRTFTNQKWNLKIPAKGKSSQLVLPSQVKSGDFLVVFKGQAGGEPNLPGAVRFEIDKPATPCGTPVKAKGGTEGYSGIHSLGGEAGEVTISFEAYKVPDSLTIRKLTGETIFQTNGLVSGLHQKTFYYNPSEFSNEQVEVEVKGNQNITTTQWQLGIGCPGKGSAFGRFNVTGGYRFNSMGSWSCHARLAIDGKLLEDRSSWNTYLSEGTHSVEFKYSCFCADSWGICNGPANFSAAINAGNNNLFLENGSYPIEITNTGFIKKGVWSSGGGPF
ncbi:hypothetical protein H0A36_26215 [Endozoicomonas sp. SM1973]|uniref:Uncharacterized protein n=1 Tax=Spartinivicinus marinus TaxID=2994442 RepID=A0A853IJE3_9GAMM|nr:hypothetical protein [Spartinivicinus marinus]MCX4030495.1 hypothetical protein [Spartinivicinus marinus]NYZ69517.1 hypothetical protein [Spartinivicinus marinus]